jgi:hypothetical protein
LVGGVAGPGAGLWVPAGAGRAGAGAQQGAAIQTPARRRAPELNPCEDLWRLMKAVVAANRCASSMDDLAQQAVAWLAALSPDDRLRCSGLLSAKFQWL